MEENVKREVFVKQYMYEMMLKWKRKEILGKNIETFLLENGYHSVAIYGMGKLGTCLFEELNKSKIEVRYGVDMVQKQIEGIQIYGPGEKLPHVDIMIISITFVGLEIENYLSDKFDGDIISIDDIINEM